VVGWFGGAGDVKFWLLAFSKGKGKGKGKEQISGGNDRKKGGGEDFDAKGAKVAKFRHADRARKKLWWTTIVVRLSLYGYAVVGEGVAVGGVGLWRRRFLLMGAIGDVICGGGICRCGIR
jgi:hypothetical protein